MFEDRRAWVIAGAAAFVLISGSSVYFYRLWRSKDGLQALSLAPLSSASDHPLEPPPPVPSPVAAAPFAKSAAYLEAAAETRQKLRASPAITKDVLLAVRVAVRELMAPSFDALHVQGIARRQACLENIPEWSSLYTAHCEDVARLVCAAERSVCADCGIPESEYRDHHRAREQKDHQYMISCIKMLESLKNECHTRRGAPLTAQHYNEILEYKLTLARNVPLEAFPVSNLRTAEHKWHIISELAYQKFGFLNGDVPAAVLENATVAASQRQLIDEFLLQPFPGLCLPS